MSNGFNKIEHKPNWNWKTIKNAMGSRREIVKKQNQREWGKDRGESIIPTMAMRIQSISERGLVWEMNEGEKTKKRRDRERERGQVTWGGGRGHVSFGRTDRRWDPLLKKSSWRWAVGPLHCIIRFQVNGLCVPIGPYLCF